MYSCIKLSSTFFDSCKLSLHFFYSCKLLSYFFLSRYIFWFIYIIKLHFLIHVNCQIIFFYSCKSSSYKITQQQKRTVNKINQLLLETKCFKKYLIFGEVLYLNMHEWILILQMSKHKQNSLHLNLDMK